LAVPVTNLFKTEGLSLDELAVLEPFAIGAHGIRRAAIKPAEFVIIIGAGRVGLAAGTFGRGAGGCVVVVDVKTERLAFCRSAMTVEWTREGPREEVAMRVRELTDGDMAPVVID